MQQNWVSRKPEHARGHWCLFFLPMLQILIEPNRRRPITAHQLASMPSFGSRFINFPFSTATRRELKDVTRDYVGMFFNKFRIQRMLGVLKEISNMSGADQHNFNWGSLRFYYHRNVGGGLPGNTSYLLFCLIFNKFSSYWTSTESLDASLKVQQNVEACCPHICESLEWQLHPAPPWKPFYLPNP